MADQGDDRKRKRRGPGEHSVYQLPDTVDDDGKTRKGLWVASMEKPGSGRNNRKRVVRKAKTKREALDKLEQAKRELFTTGAVPDQRTTVAHYLNWWLSDTVEGTVRESTLAGYRWIAEKYLIPNIGTTRLAQLGPEHVTSMLATMEKDGLSPSTRRQARTILGMALRRAQRYGMVTRNAAAMVEPPKLNRPFVDDAFSADELRRFLRHLHAREDDLVALAEVALRLGLRQGELLALRWDDVDLDAGTLHVGGTLKRRKGGGLYIDQPKTTAGNRVVPLTAHLVEELRAHRKRQAVAELKADTWQKLGFVFTTPVGTPIDSRNLTRWWHGHFAPLLDEDGNKLPDDQQLGLADRPFHSTRRTAITMMAEAGVPLEVAANIVGHSSIRMTADVYNRVKPRAQRSALDVLEAHLKG